MSTSFSSETIEQLASQSREPAWLTELRRKAWAQHMRLPWPHPSDEVWRRVDVSQLDPVRRSGSVEPKLLQRIRLSEAQWQRFATPLGGEQLAVRANGSWVVDPQLQDVEVEELAQAARQPGGPMRAAIEADGLTEAEQKLTSLNLAFHHDDVAIRVPTNLSNSPPVRLVRLFGANTASTVFPFTVIVIGSGSLVTIIDEYVGLDPTASPQAHLVNGRVELILEPNATVQYIRLQRWGAATREFFLQRATLAQGSTLTLTNIAFGAALSKTHVITKLAGAEASTKLYGFVFGHGEQHVDQHTLQDHQAPHTSSNLLFKAALQDQSRMTYTGLIRIAKDAKQTTAYQANHNLLLSQGAKAETIPMLEILADDVQCKHGASIGPIDEEQTFYLMSRGIPRDHAQRLLVMGFIEPIIQQIPCEPLQERLREEIEGNLHQ